MLASILYVYAKLSETVTSASSSSSFVMGDIKVSLMVGNLVKDRCIMYALRDTCK